jgi:predicted XRE-type DNA-binding protein
MTQKTKAKLKRERSSGNVFQDIGFPAEEAQNLLLRSDLMTPIECFVKTSGLTQKACAVQFGLTQPRLNDLLRGRIEKFSLDALVNIVSKAGMRVELKIGKAPTKKAA